MSIMSNVVTLEMLSERVGYVIEPIAAGSDKNGRYKMLEWRNHPVLNNPHWVVRDANDNDKKYDSLEEAIVDYNAL